MKKSSDDLLKQFCLIELQVLADREERLRKEILHCKIQKEYLTQVVADLKQISCTEPPLSRNIIKIETNSGEN